MSTRARTTVVRAFVRANWSSLLLAVALVGSVLTTLAIYERSPGYAQDPRQGGWVRPGDGTAWTCYGSTKVLVRDRTGVPVEEVDRFAGCLPLHGDTP